MMQSIFSFLLLSVTWWLPAVACEDGAPAVEAMRAAFDQWLQDIEFSCHYTYRKGIAESIDSGLAGNWTSVDESKSFKGVLSKGLGKVRMSIEYDKPPVLVGKTGDNAEYTNVTFDEVSSSEIGLRYSPSLEGIKDRGLAKIETRKRLDSRGDGLSPYDAGASTKRRLTPLAIDGNVIGSYFSSHGNNSSNAEVVLLESTADNIGIQIRFEAGAYKVTKDVRFTLKLKHPVVEEIRTLMDNAAGSKFESVSRATDFVNLESGPIATLVRNATSSGDLVRVTEWSAVAGEMRSPKAQDFLVPIAEKARVNGVRNARDFMTDGMLDISKVRSDDISTVYEDELTGERANEVPVQSREQMRPFLLATFAILLVGLIAWKSLRGK